jgi:hypothetical protein
MREKQPRERDEAYLDYIRDQPCCIPGCGDDVSVEAAHLRIGSINDDKPQGALSMKSGDKWALPLCGRHHREQHATGDELEWWASYGINPFELAMTYQMEQGE